MLYSSQSFLHNPSLYDLGTRKKFICVIFRRDIHDYIKGTVSRDPRCVWLLMTCMVSFRPKQRRGPFLNFLGAPMSLQ
jgi:hypothetical protein